MIFRASAAALKISLQTETAAELDALPQDALEKAFGGGL
jgi:hypothetical protein